EGGHRRGADGFEGIGPLIARLPFPSTWRCVLAVPHSAQSISGSAEDAAFMHLPPPPEREVERVAHLVLFGLLPAMVDDDLRTFGAALTAIQALNGRWFAPVQGGVFAPGPSEELVSRMREWGAAGVGQSSWGPAVYGIVGDAVAARALADRVRGALGPRGAVYEGAFSPTGARVWRGDPSVSGWTIGLFRAD